MDIEQLNITEELKWGVGVIFNEWPTQDVMLSTMREIRKQLHTKSQGDIVWHLAQTSQGWNLSGNIATITNGVTAREPEPSKVTKASSNPPL